MRAEASMAGTLLQAARVGPMLPPAERQKGPALDRAAIESLIPHRDPFLFLDRITRVDRDTSTIVCRHRPGGAKALLAGHFPGHPLWPGVLQAEAIGQAGLCLARLLHGAGSTGEWRFAFTHILGAVFARPVRPADEVEIVCRILPDGLFTILVGQCLQDDVVCSAAALRGIEEEMIR